MYLYLHYFSKYSTSIHVSQFKDFS